MNTLHVTTLTPDELKQLFKDVLREDKQQAPLSAVSQENNIISRNETAKLLKITLPTLRAWTKQGVLKSYRIESKVYYKHNELLTTENETISQKHKKR